MVKLILAVVGGFLLWSALWLGYNVLLQKAGVLPSNVTEPVRTSPALLGLLAGSVVISMIAGWVAATINRGADARAILVLAVLLLAAGIFFETQNWALTPVWYHIIFLLLLMPACLLGARFRAR